MRKLVVVVAVMLSANAAMALDLPGVNKPAANMPVVKVPIQEASDTASISNNVDAFLLSTETSNVTLNSSLDAALKSVATKEDQTKLQTQVDQLGKISDPKERDAKILEKKSEFANAIAIKPETVNRVKDLSVESKKELGSSIGKMMGVIPFNTAAITAGAKIMSTTASNPMAAAAVSGKMGQVKAGLTNLKAQTPKFKGLVTNFSYYSTESCLYTSQDAVIFKNYCYPERSRGKLSKPKAAERARTA